MPAAAAAAQPSGGASDSDQPHAVAREQRRFLPRPARRASRGTPRPGGWFRRRRGAGCRSGRRRCRTRPGARCAGTRRVRSKSQRGADVRIRMGVARAGRAERVDDLDLPRGVAEAMARDVEADGVHAPGQAVAGSATRARRRACAPARRSSRARTSAGSSARSGSFICGRIERLDAVPARGQRLFADPADRQHESGERDFARHRHVRLHRHASRRRHDRRRHRHAGRRSVLGDGARRHVDVEIVFAQEFGTVYPAPGRSGGRATAPRVPTPA